MSHGYNVLFEKLELSGSDKIFMSIKIEKRKNKTFTTRDTNKREKDI